MPLSAKLPHWVTWAAASQVETGRSSLLMSNSHSPSSPYSWSLATENFQRNLGDAIGLTKVEGVDSMGIWASLYCVTMKTL